MAILRAMDGTYYEVPDDQVARFKIPEDQLKQKIGAMVPTEEPPPDEPPPGAGSPSPLVNVQIYYTGQGAGGAPGGAEAAVQPYDWRNWRNWRNWHNWRNHHWRNHWD
jgi:hypothetical protein